MIWKLLYPCPFNVLQSMSVKLFLYVWSVSIHSILVHRFKEILLLVANSIFFSGGSCTCQPPYVLVGDQCQLAGCKNNGDCKSGKATCVKITGGVSYCACPPGYQTSESGECIGKANFLLRILSLNWKLSVRHLEFCFLFF